MKNNYYLDALITRKVPILFVLSIFSGMLINFSGAINHSRSNDLITHAEYENCKNITEQDSRLLSSISQLASFSDSLPFNAQPLSKSLVNDSLEIFGNQEISSFSGSIVGRDYYVCSDYESFSFGEGFSPAGGTFSPDGTFEAGKPVGIYEFTYTVSGPPDLVTSFIVKVKHAVRKRDIVGKPSDKPVVLIYNMQEEDLDGIKFQWYKDDLLMEGETKQFYYPLSGDSIFGSYHVEVTTTEECLTVSDKYIFPKSITNSSDKSEVFHLFPNPATHQITIQLRSDLYFSGSSFPVTISDLSGRQLLGSTVGAGHDIVSVSGLPDGVYLVSLFANGAQYFQRLIILKK
jgi:hypothetical protein